MEVLFGLDECYFQLWVDHFVIFLDTTTHHISNESVDM